MAHLFTIICEFKGGTYTKQLNAEGPLQAFEQWAERFATEDFLSPLELTDFAAEVLNSLAENNIVAMQGLQNVWYEGFSLGDDLLEVILVAMTPSLVTTESPAPSPA